MALGLIIFLVALFIVLTFALLYAYVALERRKSIEKGIRIYKYNHASRTIQARDLNQNRSGNIFRKDNLPQVNRLINDELSFVFNSPGEKLLRQALHNCSKKMPKIDFRFTAKIPELRNHEFDVKMGFVLTNDDHYIINLTWSITMAEKQNRSREHLVKKIERKDMYALDAPVTGYVIFNIRKEESTENRLVDIVASVWKREFKYFVSGGILAIVFQGASVRKVAARIERFVKRFASRGIQLGAHQLYNGSSYAYVQNGNHVEQQNKLFRIMEFYINLSIDQNRDFLTPHKDELANVDDNMKFLEGLEVFKEAIYDKKVIIEFTSVKRYGSNNKAGNYVVPKIKGLNDYVQNIIVRNSNNKKALMNVATEIVSQSKGDESMFVDVNAMWLIKNVFHLQNKKAVYVVDMEEQIEIEELRKTISELVRQKFVFGLRVTVFNEKTSILIKRCEIQFIVIDKRFMANGDLFDSNAYIDLITIAEFAQKANMKILYEKPSEFIDKSTSQKIGLKYYF